MKTHLITCLLASAFALCGSAAAFADDENKLVIKEGQQRVWKYVKTDASSTFLSHQETEKLETIDLDKSDRKIRIEPIETLKEPSIVRTDNQAAFKYEVAPNSRVYIGLPDRSEQEAQEIEYKKYNYYRSAKMPDGRYVEPLYTVAGAGVKTRF
jgi:hypothetical protein